MYKWKAPVKTSGMALEAGPSAQCRLAQDQLEDAINEVMKTEQQLRENSREVRGSLQSTVSRQQEALRCREVYLLDQIHLLEQVKTDTLTQQLTQLHRLRGQFDVIVHQLQNRNTNDLNNQLISCLEKLSSLSLTPEESPEMSFYADTRSMRQAITSFGSVTAQLEEGVSSVSPAPKAKSCPITAQTQMASGALNQWLLGTHPQSSAAIGYQGSKNPQDWLVAQKESKTACPVLASIDFLSAWGQLRDLEAWLIRDVIRERTNSGSSSSFSIEEIDESEYSIPEEEELNDWLITPHSADTMDTGTDTATDAEKWRRVMKPFENDWLSSDWLVEPSSPAPNNAPSNAAECSSCCQSQAPVAMEIENLGNLLCLKTPPTPALEAWLQQVSPVAQSCRANEPCGSYSDCVCEESCSKDALSQWLLRQDGRDKNGVKTKDTPTEKSQPMTDKTEKNAPIADKHQKPEKNQPTADEHQKPEQPITKHAKTAAPFHLREQEQKVQAILEAWLQPRFGSAPKETEEKGSREEQSASPFLLPLDTHTWMLPAHTHTPVPAHTHTPVPAQTHTPVPAQTSLSEDKWLMRKRSHAQAQDVLPSSVCDLFSCMKVDADKEKWLHSAPEQM